MSRRNDEVAAALTEVADLLEIRGDDRFRILGYRRAAEAVAGLGEDVGSMDDPALRGVRGVGKATAGKIRQLVDEGTFDLLEELRAQIPSGVRMLTTISGVGPKTAKLLHDELGVSDIDSLRAAAEQQLIRGVKGLGPKAEENIVRALERYTGPEERRTLLVEALALAEAIVEELSGHPAVQRCAYAGSLRRMRETIGDLDILAAGDDHDAMADAFARLDVVGEVKAGGETKTSVVTHRGMQIDLRVVDPDCFGAALQYFTGSKDHNVKVREHAVKQGRKLSEYGLFDADTDERIAGATEEEVYAALGMQWIPPTMREDTGEVEAALRGGLPSVVELEHIRGDLQSHSTASDGKTSVRQMAKAAAAKGYAYYAITDHGRNLTFMKNLSEDAIRRQRREVAKLNDELDITVLHGVELNIARDGSLDYPDEILAGFDVCVASVHSQFDLASDVQTERLVRAIRNPHVHIIGHPSGRRLDRRPGIDFDVDAVARTAAEHGVALEVNAHPYRLDLRDTHVRWALERGAYLVISTDAHSPAELDNMHFGVATAQRGWATPDRVINTWPLRRLRSFLARRG